MGQTSLLLQVEEFDNIITFLTWFGKVARAAEGTQEQAMKCDEDMRSVELCAHDLPRNRCEVCCTILQSGETPESVPPSPQPTPAPQASPEAPPAVDSDETYQSGIPFFDTQWCRRMFNRAEEEVEDDITNRERSTMAYLLWKMKFESVLVRILVWWYWFNLWACGMYWWYDVAAAWLLGPLYWPWLVMRFMHWPAFRQIIVKYIGFRMYRKIRSPQAIKICASIVGAVTVLKTSQVVYRMIYENQVIVSICVGYAAKNT